MPQQSEILAKYRTILNAQVKPIENARTKELDNMDFVDFLFEIIRSTKGQKEFKNTVLRGCLSEVKKKDEINNKIKQAFINKFVCDLNLFIPNKYTTKSNIGINLSKNVIDKFGLLAISPDTKLGSYLYDGSDVSQHINYAFYKSQFANQKTVIEHDGKTLFTIKQTSVNDFSFQFGEYYANKSFGVWITDYLTKVQPIFNTTNFTTILMDIVTGAVSLKIGKNKSEIKTQTINLKFLEKLFGFCGDKQKTNDQNVSANTTLKQDLLEYNNKNNISGFGGSVNDNDGFSLNFSDLLDIEKRTELRNNCMIKFSTCGDLNIQLDPDLISNGLDALFDSSEVDVLYDYSEDQNKPIVPQNTIINNFSDTQMNLDGVVGLFEDVLKNGASRTIQGGETSIRVDLPNINAEFQLNILKQIPYALSQTILSPKILIIPELFRVLFNENKNVTEKSNGDPLSVLATVIQDIGGEITKMLIKNIFNSIKTDLVKRSKKIVSDYLKQRGADYLGVLNTLISLLTKLKKDNDDCGGILNKMFKLLEFSNYLPMPPLPPPLIFVAGALKPGINSVSMIQEVKSKLISKGIETAPTLPDGTPNNMMIAIEETIKTMVTQIKNNSQIQVFGMSAAGPVTAYGQIQ